MANNKNFKIDSGTGRIASVQQIDEEWSNHIYRKGYMGEFPQVGNYFEYDAFGEGTYIVYDKDFVENQIEVDKER